MHTNMHVSTPPSRDTQLSHCSSIRAIRQSFSLLAVALEFIYEEDDAEAFGLAKLVKSYNFIATVSMLCDALDPVARLSTALQAKALDFAELSFLVFSLHTSNISLITTGTLNIA